MNISNLETFELNAIFTQLNSPPTKITDLDRDVQFISINKEALKTQDYRIVHIRLKPDEAKKAHECQKVMLQFMKAQYNQSIGTEKEEMMRKMYNDALIDFEDVEAQYKDELST